MMAVSASTRLPAHRRRGGVYGHSVHATGWSAARSVHCQTHGHFDSRVATGRIWRVDCQARPGVAAQKHYGDRLASSAYEDQMQTQDGVAGVTAPSVGCIVSVSPAYSFELVPRIDPEATKDDARLT